VSLTDGRGGFIDYLLERDDVVSPWKAYTEHEFLQRLADGTLPEEQFKHYLIQDYLFLVSSAGTPFRYSSPWMELP